MISAQLPLLDEEYDPTLSQWYTDPKLAAQIVKWALKGHGLPLYIMEPSAGLGALAVPARSFGCGHIVDCWEIDHRRVEVLRQRLGPTVNVFCQDYLNDWHGRRYDLCIQNPPYEEGQAERFVRKAAFECDRVVALLRSSALFGVDRWSLLWSAVAITRIVLLIRRPVFGGSQSNSPNGDYIVVECQARERLADRGRPETVEMEWW